MRTNTDSGCFPSAPFSRPACGALLSRRANQPGLVWKPSLEQPRLPQRPADNLELANVQLEYAKAVGEKRAVYTGALPSLAGILLLLDRKLIDPAVRESARLRAELAPILAEARRRLHAARE